MIYQGLYFLMVQKALLSVFINYMFNLFTDDFIERERISGIDNPALSYNEIDHNYWYSYRTHFDQDMASGIRNGTTVNCCPPAYAVREAQHNEEMHSCYDSSSDRGSHRKNSHSEDEVDLENEDDKGMGCVPEFQFSIIDSEYDETLGFPDSVTILSTVGDKPVLVERTNTDEDEEEDDEDVRQREEADIPFSSLYGPSVKFNSFQRKVFIPGLEIEVKIIDTDRSVTTHLLNPNL